MLLKCYHYSHPMEKFEVRCASQTTKCRFQFNLFFTMHAYKPKEMFTIKQFIFGYVDFICLNKKPGQIS